MVILKQGINDNIYIPKGHIKGYLEKERREKDES